MQELNPEFWGLFLQKLYYNILSLNEKTLRFLLQSFFMHLYTTDSIFMKDRGGDSIATTFAPPSVRSFTRKKTEIKKCKNPLLCSGFLQRFVFGTLGAGGRTRTDTGLPPLDFESSASAISPLRQYAMHNV